MNYRPTHDDMERTPRIYTGRLRHSRRRYSGSRYLPILLAGMLATYFAGCAYNGFASRFVTRSDAQAKRDPATGVLVGAEERRLGPALSPTAVLLVHGYIGAGNNFNTLPETLAAKGWYVEVMRLPGHGTSPRDLVSVTETQLEVAVTDRVKTLKDKHKQVFVVGHSMGGALSAYAAAFQDVDGIVLAAPYFGVTYHWYYGLKPEQWATASSFLIKWVYKGKLFLQVNRPEAKDQIVSYTWAPTSSMLRLIDVGNRAKNPALIRRVTCPVLLLHSKNDVAASPKEAEKAFGYMASKDKKIVWYEKSNHHLFWDYDSDAVIAEIVAFIQSHVAPPPVVNPYVFESGADT